jgi:hypothetical protein
MTTATKPAADIVAAPRRVALDAWRHWTGSKPSLPPRLSSWPRPMRIAFRVGMALIGVEFLCLCVWSHILASRFSLTWDFSLYEQAATLISRGDLNPLTTSHSIYFWQDHGDFLFWPISLLYGLAPHPVTLLWMQDLVTTLGDGIAFLWLSEVVATRFAGNDDTRLPTALISLGGILIVFNPWIAAAMSFDMHTEAFATLFALGTARALYQGRRSALVWTVVGMALGDLGATYILGVGVSALLNRRYGWRRSLSVVAIAAGWLVLLGHIGASKGDALNMYSYLLAGHVTDAHLIHSPGGVLGAIAEHPGRALGTVWNNRTDLWANLSSTGLIGAAWLPVLAPVAVLLTESQLSPIAAFALPGFQSQAILPLTAVGTIALLAAIGYRPGFRHRRSFLALLGVLAVNAMVWEIVWIPSLPTQYLRITPAGAQVLRQLSAQIKPTDEVISSQGFVGEFADRRAAYSAISTGLDNPVTARRVWVILSAFQGINVMSPDQTYAAITALSADPNFRLVLAKQGIFAFLGTLPPSVHRLDLNPSVSSPVPAAFVAGAAGDPVLSGRLTDWHVVGNGSPGYVVDHDYYRRDPGHYQANVSLAATGQVDLEVWNSDTGQLIARAENPGTSGIETISLPIRLSHAPPPLLFSGWSLWSDSPPEPSGDNLEIRVWTPGGADQVSVYSVQLVRLGSSR